MNTGTHQVPLYSRCIDDHDQDQILNYFHSWQDCHIFLWNYIDTTYIWKNVVMECRKCLCLKLFHDALNSVH